MFNKYILLFIGSVFIASCAQIILKTSTNKNYETYYKQYLNWNVFMGYAILGLTSLTAIIAYKGVDLKLGSILQCTGYLFIILLSGIFLNEYPTKNKLLGTFFIIIGIIIFNL
jgi:drug/metabolite transporter (DMT)-like permease